MTETAHTPSEPVQARFVNERHHVCDEKSGPGEYGRIGFSIGPEVFWTGSYFFPGTSGETYDDADKFARTVVRRWNCHDELLMALKLLLSLCEAGGDPFDEPGRPTVARASAAISAATPKD